MVHCLLSYQHTIHIGYYGLMELKEHERMRQAALTTYFQRILFLLLPTLSLY